MFKIGDKVKITETNKLDIQKRKFSGLIGIIDYRHPILSNWVVRFDIGWMSFNDEELELIESMPSNCTLATNVSDETIRQGACVTSDKIRTFGTGATRDTDLNKLDYEGFLSPLVLERYAQYLNKHRIQSDGQLRDSDNWQKGIPKDTYIKSKFRHFIATWLLHRGHLAKDEKGNNVSLEESLCGDIFNTMGYLHELLEEKESIKPKQEII